MKNLNSLYSWRQLVTAVAAINLCATLTVSAGIPTQERENLIALYTSAGGNGWSNNANWCSGACTATGTPSFNTSGTECTWFGIVCDPSNSHVIVVNLPSNNLSGSIPSLEGLTQLAFFYAYSNQLSGPIPPLSGLTQLSTFVVSNNHLTGLIPSLTGLTHLAVFDVDTNDLSGQMPTLAGLTQLVGFYAFNNQLSGPIPSLSGLSRLNSFIVFNNHLTGPIPSLSELTNLNGFFVNDNELTGPVPAVAAGRPRSARLCPNRLDTTPTANDAAWDTATQTTPWWATPFSSNRCDEVFFNGFD